MTVVAISPERALHSVMVWDTVVQHAAFSHRDSCCGFRHAGLFWLSNGYQYGTANNRRDLWCSDDLVRWVRRNSATPYQGYSPVASFDGKIVACGDKVYVSDDMGATFTVALDDPPFAVSTSTVYTPRLLARGGKLLLFVQDQLWVSEDLETWTSVSLPWQMRVNFAIWDFKGSVYIAAGNNDTRNDPQESGYPSKTSFNDVWRSADPTLGAENWTRLTASAPWSSRMWPGYCVHGDEMVIGYGYKNTAPVANWNDLWASRDGVNWREISQITPASRRHFPTMFSHAGSVWMMTGNQNPSAPGTLNDVLRLRNV